MSETKPEVDPVTKVARDLTEIENLACHLEAQALARANDRGYLPGGDAMVALVRVADLDEWGELIASAELRHYAGCDKVDHRDCTVHGAEHVEDEDDQHAEDPLRTLLFWTDAWRSDHGYPLEGRRPTLSTEASFIRHMLNWAWDNEMKWDDFARDVNRTRRRLENILHAGRRTERSGVNCIEDACERKPRLIKVYQRTAVEDHYKCPSCKARYTPQRYRLAKAELLNSQGAERHVKAQDARDAIGRSSRTWRKWLRYWYVRSYRDPLTGQVWVWWPDVREVDRDTQRRNREVA